MRVFLFLSSLFLYLATLAPDIYWGDSSETVIGFYFLGKYFIDLPFFSFYFGKIFTFVPVENISFRVNLFSAFTSSIAMVIFYDILLFFLKDGDKKLTKISSLIGCMFFLTSYTIWRFAVVGESISFVFLCYLSLLYLLLKSGQQDIRVLHFVSFICAFFVNFSTIMDFYFHFFIIFLIYTFVKSADFKNFITMFLFYIFGLLFFFILFFYRRMHYDYDILTLFNYYLNLLSTSFKPSLLSIFGYFLSLLYYLDRQIPLHIGIFSVLGLFYIFKFKKSQFQLLFLIFFCPFIFMLFKSSFEDIFSYEHHFFSVYLLLFVLFVYTIYFALKHFNFKISLIMFTLVFFIHLVSNYQLNNKKDLRFARKETLELLNNIEPDAIVITQNLELKKLINYFQLIEHKRKDISIIGLADLSNPVFLELIIRRKLFFDDTIPFSNFQDILKNINIIIKSAKGRPLYLLFSKDINPEEKILYKQFASYNKKFIIKFTEFKGEKLPSPFIYNLIKIEK